MLAVEAELSGLESSGSPLAMPEPPPRVSIEPLDMATEAGLLCVAMLLTAGRRGSSNYDGTLQRMDTAPVDAVSSAGVGDAHLGGLTFALTRLAGSITPIGSPYPAAPRNQRPHDHPDCASALLVGADQHGVDLSHPRSQRPEWW
jgi:sugar/nucleoside kinase (ribokinase family)